MAKNTVQVNVGSALTKIEFKDDDGIVLGFLKINLTDVRLVGKLEKIAKFFADYQFEGDTMEYLLNLDNLLVQKFSYLLGYDCSDTLFGILSPTTITDRGEMFAHEILGKISETFSEKIKERAAARAAAISKYTQKYK